MATVFNIAHRGARSLAPENTLAAARKALEIGADLWETDIVGTADGELILLHDESLSRTTNAQIRFPDRAPWAAPTFTLAEIRSLDAGSWFVESDPFGQVAAGAVTPGELLAYVCESVPTVREALSLTQEASWRVNLELKRTPTAGFPIVERLLELIDELEIETDRIVISSFNHEWLRQARKRSPRLSVQALVGGLGAELADPQFDTYNASAALVDEDQVRVLIGKGVAVNLYTVNSESDMRRYVAAGVAGLITDFPQRLRAVLQSAQHTTGSDTHR